MEIRSIKPVRAVASAQRSQAQRIRPPSTPISPKCFEFIIPKEQPVINARPFKLSTHRRKSFRPKTESGRVVFNVHTYALNEVKNRKFTQHNEEPPKTAIPNEYKEFKHQLNASSNPIKLARAV